MTELAGKTTIVVGASRGLGRGVAEAFDAAGASVVAVARDTSSVADLALRHAVHLEAADATDPNVAGMLLERHDPDAEFLTPPKDHSREIRCYMRDPDGHLIEVGQSTGALN